MGLLGIRPSALRSLFDELGQLQPRTDQLELDLARLMALSELDEIDAVKVRDIGESASALAQHLGWVHDELVGFSVDGYLSHADGVGSFGGPDQHATMAEPTVARDPDSYLRAAARAVKYQNSEGGRRVSLPYKPLVLPSTESDGDFARATVHLAILLDISLDEAAGVLGPAINVVPWWDEGTMYVGGPTYGEVGQAKATVAYVQLLAELPAGVTQPDVRQMIIDHATALIEEDPHTGFPLLMLADVPLGQPPVLAPDQVEMVAELSTLGWENVDLNQLFSTIGLGVDLFNGPKAVAVVGALATAGIGITFFDALERQDNDAAFEILLDSAIPTAIKVLLMRWAPAVAGPIGWIAALVLTFTSFGGPESGEHDRAPSGGSVNELGQHIAVSDYTNVAGIPTPQRGEKIDTDDFLAALLLSLLGPKA